MTHDMFATALKQSSAPIRPRWAHGCKVWMP